MPKPFKVMQEAWEDYFNSPEFENLQKETQVRDVHEAFKQGFGRAVVDGDIDSQVRAWQKIYDRLQLAYPSIIGQSGMDTAMKRLEHALSGNLTPGQQALKERHGTPEEFTDAVIKAIGEITKTEALEAIAKYRAQWRAS